MRIGTLASGHVFASDAAAAVADMFAAIVAPSYDDAGNMTSDGIYNYTYDAWNRLVKVTRLGPTSAPQAIATYAYDGLGRRHRKIVTHSGDRNREAEYFYYDSHWRLLEVRNGSDAATRQFVWGTQYIDELVCMDVDTDADGLCTDENEVGYGFERYRYFQDANWNVVAIWAEHAGHVVERYEYDPYGTCRIFAGWDSTAGCETGNVLGDSLVPGGNPIRYAGYHFDNETAKYQVRYRMYSPELGRWLQRDPAGYVDGSDLYSYARSSPIQNTDPRGLRIVAWRGDGVSPDNPNPSGRPDPSDPWQRTPLEQQDCGFCVYRADYTLTDCGHTWIGPCGDPTKWGLDSPAYWRSSAKCASKMWHTVRSPDNKKSCDAIYACLEKAMKTVGAGGGWVPGVNDCRTATNEAMAQCGLRRADLVELTPAPDCPKCPSAFSLLGINYWETSPLDW